MASEHLPPSQPHAALAGTQDPRADGSAPRPLVGDVRQLNITHLAIVCIDERGRVSLFNQGAEKLFGYPQAAILGQAFSRLLCPEFRAREKNRLAALVRIARDNPIGFRTDSVVCLRKNGERFPSDIALSQGHAHGQRFYTLVIQDTTDRVRQAQQLAYKAEHDPLTDLPNRVLLYDSLRKGVARADRFGRKLGVVYIDLDQFKPVNDRYGHDYGDRLLQAVAQRLRDTVRQTDLVSRIGGDEFIVSLEQIRNRQEALAAGNKILTALLAPFAVLGRELQLAASVGVAVYPDHGLDIEALLQAADQAMYAAKKHHSGLEMYQAPEPTRA